MSRSLEEKMCNTSKQNKLFTLPVTLSSAGVNVVVVVVVAVVVAVVGFVVVTLVSLVGLNEVVV